MRAWPLLPLMLAGGALLRPAYLSLRALATRRGAPAVAAASAKMATAAPDAKRAKTGKVIGTHDGTFHCDEALGCFLLRRTAAFKDADVVRTRDAAALAPLDAVLDVGGVYDPARCRPPSPPSSLNHAASFFWGGGGGGPLVRTSAPGCCDRRSAV